MLPCGTEKLIVLTSKKFSSICTLNCLFVKYDFNQCRAKPQIPEYLFKTSSSILWLTVSKAALRSSATIGVFMFFSMFCKILSHKFSIAVLVEWFAL